MTLDCNNINLKRGSKGEQVKELQTQLKLLKFYLYKIDGDYGKYTVNAVKKYQRQTKTLAVDGVFGSKTCKSWNTYYTQNTTTKTATTSTGSTKTITTTTVTTKTVKESKLNCNNINLKKGSTGSQVKQLQTELKELKYYSRQIDGNYGTYTVNAVKQFQRQMKTLAVDGIFGQKTCKKWHEYYKKNASSTSKNTDSGLDLSGLNCKTVSLKKGSTGSQVKLLQTALKALGYYTRQVDGNYGTYTVSAVKKLQRATKHTADGWFGSKTCPDLKKLCDQKGLTQNGGQALNKGTTANLTAKQKRNKTIADLYKTYIGTRYKPNVYLDGVGFMATEITPSNNQGGTNWQTVELMNNKLYTYQGHRTTEEYSIVVPVPYNMFLTLKKYLYQLCNQTVAIQSKEVNSSNYYVSYTYKKASKSNWQQITFSCIRKV